MQTAIAEGDRSAAIERASISGPAASETKSDLRALIALKALRVLASSAIGQCVTHGYRKLPTTMGSDLDILVDTATTTAQIARLLLRSKERIGADVVQVTFDSIVLAALDEQGDLAVLTFDIAHDRRCDGTVLYRAAEVLTRRRRHQGFMIPAVADEFGLVLTAAVAKGKLKLEREVDLEQLYREDPAGCDRVLERFWPPHWADRLRIAAARGDWTAVRSSLSDLRAVLKPQYAPPVLGTLLSRAERLFTGVRNVFRPQGLSIVLLGPDGAGKSTLSDELFKCTSALFPRQASWGFAPPLRRLLLRSGPPSTSDPHGLTKRSAAVSLLRAGYWYAHGLVTAIHRRIAKARRTLVIYDRHFVDVLVDQKRYRYGGPLWVLQVLWRLMPKPDMILLLDVPADILQQRKQEVPFDVSAQQRSAYLDVVGRLGNGRVINGGRERFQVVNSAVDAILDQLAERVARRLG